VFVVGEKKGNLANMVDRQAQTMSSSVPHPINVRMTSPINTYVPPWTDPPNLFTRLQQAQFGVQPMHHETRTQQPTTPQSFPNNIANITPDGRFIFPMPVPVRPSQSVASEISPNTKRTVLAPSSSLPRPASRPSSPPPPPLGFERRESASFSLERASASSRSSGPVRTGVERFEFIREAALRKASQSKQIKQIKIDLLRLLLTTGAHSALLVVPESWKVHKFATAGDFNSFLEMYATALEAQRKRHRRQVALNIDDVWERFQGQYGVHRIESLCSALLKQGCDADLLDDVKDTYLASLIGENQADPERRLASHLSAALQNYVAEKAQASGGSGGAAQEAGE
jgi:hypothetical protein